MGWAGDPVRKSLLGIEAEPPDLRPQADPVNDKKGYKNLQNLLDVLLQYAKLDILNHTG